jgi:hypothetical protein
MAQAAAKGIAEGLTAKETADKYGFSAPGMYNAAVRQGLRFRSHMEKFGTRKGRPMTKHEDDIRRGLRNPSEA